jgi:Pyruvate/2-oxoacid:ferredoxin oxidoreductase delta subunit/flavodoxin
MKTVLYYFSSTGNSLWVARKMAAQLGETTLISLPTKGNVRVDNDIQRVGIVFPVIMFGLPRLIEKFIDTVEITGSPYLFAVATSGGMPLSTLIQAKKAFECRGIKMSGGYSVSMVHNCISLSSALVPEKQVIRFQKAVVTIDRICSQIRKQETYLERGIPLLNWYLSGILYEKAKKLVATASKYFYTDDNCNGCGMCVNVCPVKNVKMKNRKPCWGNACEQCYACLQWCPKESIQVKNKKTEGRRRYHHPEIAFSDIAKD